MSTSDISTETDSGCSRRDVLERGAASAGTVGAIAVGGHKVAPQYSPIGRAEALVHVAVAAGALAVAAGIAYADWQSPDTDIDEDDVLEDQIYSAAQSVAVAFDRQIDEIQYAYLSDEAPSTPFENAAWQEVRTTTARGATNGDPESTIVSDAVQAVNEQATAAIINTVELWNTVIVSLVEQFVLDVDHSIGVLDFRDGRDLSSFQLSTVTSDSGLEEAFVYENSDGENEYVITKDDVDLPTSVNNLDDREEDLVAYRVHARNNQFDYDMGLSTQLTPDRDTPTLSAKHSDLPTIEVINPSIISNVVDEIEDARQDIVGKIPDYVPANIDQIDQGAIDPDDLLSSQDIVEQFGDSDGIDRAAAELTAVGANVPDEWSFRAEISHPDLDASSVWGILFPEFDDDEMPPISPGTTLEPEDYRMAYFAYEGEVSGSADTRILSGEEPLEILDLDGLEGQQTLDESGATAGTLGEIVLWTGDDPPEPITDPAEHEGWTIVVEGESNTHRADVADAEQDGDDWILPESDLQEGEEIDYVEIIPSPNYTRPVDYVADPSEPDENTVERIEHLNETIDELEEALSDDAHGGGGGGGGGADSQTLLLGGGIIALVGMIMAVLSGDE